MTGPVLAGRSHYIRWLSVRRRAPPLILAGLVFLLTGLLAAVVVGLSERQRFQALWVGVEHLAVVHADRLQRHLERDRFAADTAAAFVRQARGHPESFAVFPRELLPFHPGLVARHLAPSGVARFPRSPDPGGLSRLTEQGYAYRLWRLNPTTQGIDVIATSSEAPIEPVVRPLMVPNALWFLDVSPVRGWDDPLGLGLKVALGLAFSLLVATLAKLLIEARSHAKALESLVAERTGEILARESDLRHAEAVAGIGSWIHDLGSGASRASAQGYRLIGLPPGEPFSVGRFREQVDPADRELVDRAWQGALEGRAYEIEHRVQREGRIRWVRNMGEIERAGDGSPSRVIVTLRDITERQAAERELRIAAIVFESQEGMLVTDANNVILRVNHAFCVTTGYGAEEVVGRTPRFLQSGRHDRAFYAIMWDSVARDGGWRGEVWNRRKSGEIYPEWLTITAVKDAGGRITNFVGTHTDITQRKADENEIRHLAFYDPLTQLPNRRLLMDRLNQTLANSIRHHQRGALLFVDLDNFKTLNDTHGHAVGDQLLQQVARRLSDGVREGDTVARLGGDEFVVMLQGLGASREEAAQAARTVGEKIQASLNRPYALGDLTHGNTPSIGVILFGEPDDSIDALLRHADLAMYQAKAAGRNRLCFFDPDRPSVLAARAGLEEDFRRELETGQLMLHYQPQVDDRGRLVGAEALVRWRHPSHGWVSPGEILRLAEATGQRRALSLWILDGAGARLAYWAERPDWTPPRLAINISPAQFRHPEFLSDVQEMLARHRVAPGRLMLEITESLAQGDLAETAARMVALKAHGVGFALDNFGTSSCSLTLLRQLPFDQIKIAPVFVRHILEHPNGEVVTRSFMDLARGLGLEILAEGIETEEQRALLARHACDAFQGYLIGRPGPVDALGAA